MVKQMRAGELLMDVARNRLWSASIMQSSMFGLHTALCTCLLAPVVYLLIGRAIWWDWFSPQHLLVPRGRCDYVM